MSCLLTSKIPYKLSTRSEVDDINYGLSHYLNSFDVVYTRLIAAGVRVPFY